jgi:hypothetical protein
VEIEAKGEALSSMLGEALPTRRRLQSERQAKSRIGWSSIALGALPVTLCLRSQKTTPTIRAEGFDERREER